MSSMNKRAKRITAACASAAVVTAGGVAIGVSVAGADATTGEIFSFGPSTSSATIVDTNPAASNANAGLTYGLKVKGASVGDTDPLYVSVLSGPGSLKFERIAANGTPVAAGVVGAGVVDSVPAAVTADISGTVTAGSSIPLSTAPSPALKVGDGLIIGGQAAAVASVVDTTHITLDRNLVAGANNAAVTYGDTFNTVAALATALVPNYSSATGDNIYLGATTPGTYKLQFFKDRNGDGNYSSISDAATPQFTLNVKDVTGATALDTSDDLDFKLSAPTNVDLGQPITAVARPDLTPEDTRGTSLVGSDQVGKLAQALAAQTVFTFANGGIAGAHAPTATLDGFSYTTGNTSNAATAVTTTPTLTYTGGGPYAPGGSQVKTTNVVDNNVSAVALSAVENTGKIKLNGATVNVKTGNLTVVYTATVTDTDSDKSGNKVYFTLGGGDVAKLTTDGTEVDKTTHVYSATTDSKGVAKLSVTDGATTPATYTVAAKSNTHASAPVTLTAVYGDPAASALDVTNTDAELAPVVGDSATLKGRILDQFGAPYTPAGSETQQVQVFVGTPGNPGGAVTPSTVALAKGNVLQSGGTFSYTYTPASAAAAGQTQDFAFAYDVDKNGTFNNGVSDLNDLTVSDTLSWASAAKATAVSIAAPAKDLTGINLSTRTTLVVGNNTQVFGSAGSGNDDGEVSGVVKDKDGNVLPFRKVTLSGSDGVYFSTSTSPDATATPSTGLSQTLDVVSDASGVFRAYAVFTKAGEAKITASVDGVSETNVVTTDDATEAYRVTVNSPTGVAGSNLAVNGKVTDVFGSPVSGVTVSLSTGDSSIGSLGSSTTTTNADGAYSTTFFASSDVKSDASAKVTASLAGPAANFKLLSPNPWAGWGVSTLTDGAQSAQGWIKVQAQQISIIGPKSVTGGGWATIQGTTLPDGLVTVSKKTKAGLVDVAALKADSNGHFSAKAWVDATTTFVAKLGTTAISNEWTVKSYSAVKITGTKKGKKSRVNISAKGTPLSGGSFTLWQKVHGKYKAILTVKVKGNTIAFSVKATKTRQYYAVSYQSPGSYASSAAKFSVKR